MNANRSGILVRATLLAAALALGGCVVAPLPPPYGPVVGYAPPAPQGDYMGAAPAPGYVWSAGYWGWTGARYAWTPGYWVAPRAGYGYMQPHWAAVPGGWSFRGGYWAR